MRPAAQLLLVEAEALPAVLARAEPSDFDRPTICVGWSVRDVLAHCSAALTALVTGTTGKFTPEENQRDVDARSSWPVERVIAELLTGYRAAADIIDAAGGPADGLGVGEWIHGGDVREPLGERDAYASAGVELAIGLLGERSVARSVPALDVVVDGDVVPFGSGPAVGRLVADRATFVRLVSGRHPDPQRFELTGPVDQDDLVLFR
jgi:uncharacterized protein (TIGR03083 family)